MGLGIVVLLGGIADIVPEITACGVAVKIEATGEPGGDPNDRDSGEDGVGERGDLADLLRKATADIDCKGQNCEDTTN